MALLNEDQQQEWTALDNGHKMFRQLFSVVTQQGITVSMARDMVDNNDLELPTIFPAAGLRMALKSLVSVNTNPVAKKRKVIIEHLLIVFNYFIYSAQFPNCNFLVICSASDSRKQLRKKTSLFMAVNFSAPSPCNSRPAMAPCP